MTGIEFGRSDHGTVRSFEPAVQFRSPTAIPCAFCEAIGRQLFVLIAILVVYFFWRIVPFAVICCHFWRFMEVFDAGLYQMVRVAIRLEILAAFWIFGTSLAPKLSVCRECSRFHPKIVSVIKEVSWHCGIKLPPR